MVSPRQDTNGVIRGEPLRGSGSGSERSGGSSPPPRTKEVGGEPSIPASVCTVGRRHVAHYSPHPARSLDRGGDRGPATSAGASRDATADAGHGSSSGCSCTTSAVGGTGRARREAPYRFTLPACVQRRPGRQSAARSAAASALGEPNGGSGGEKKEGGHLQNPPGSLREEVAERRERA